METTDPRDGISRRRVLAGLVASGSAGLAGCGSTSGDGTPAGPDFDRLGGTPVHVAEAIDLSVPDAVPTVGSRPNADLLVLPGDASVDPERVADWLADGSVLALFGPAGQATWIEWARSDAVDDHFDTRGFSESEPAPQLVVTGAASLSLPTYRTTWGDGPSNGDVWTAIDDALADLHDRRRDS